MAEKNDSWLGSWLNAAKNKSTEVFDLVRTDLEEFGSVVKSEVNGIVSSTGSVVEKALKLDSPDSTASSMKRSFSSFLGQVNTVLNPSPDDSDTEAILIVENSETVTLTKLQQAVYQLQKDPVTYLADPDESLLKQFQCWLEIVDDQLSSERIEKHLNSSSVLKNQYTQLVPDSVEHSIFWKRYLFKKALLEDDIARQEALEKREQKEKQMTEENLKWEQDFANDVELTEEEQIKLLEQYEYETKTKKQSPKRIKSPIGEDVVFKQESQKNKAKPTKNAEDIIEEKANINKVDSSNSLDTPSSNSSSAEDDWEKISDIDK
ncbi:BSD domain-containing protein 1 isoform X2 [Aethina tumida]|uniref:BSD domain-containing protein 1 isoform X2 n=1 Tax=Aethina tumida TaxID=116153 RepID=UPI00096B40AE|nr:BSD domain-containing protein 1 isoform X2 [Aethina tumida]